MSHSLVSVIIPVFNRAAMLEQAMQSVLAQSHRPIELIVVDDGSTDDTYDCAVRMAQQARSDNFHIQILRQDNAGPGVARQSGLDQAQGDYIQFLDSDDLLESEKLRLQVAGLDANNDCGVSYCIQRLITIEGQLLESAWMRSGERHLSMFPAMLAGRLWGTPVPLYRKMLLDKIGPWTELHSEEDWEYDCRVASQHIKLHYVDQTLVTIRRHREEHFGMSDTGDQHRKLEDRCLAYLAIHKHAQSAGINANAVEYITFRKMAFHVCRQASAAGIGSRSKELFYKVVKAYSTDELQFKIKIRLYEFAAKILGWQRVGQWVEKLDHWRIK